MLKRTASGIMLILLLVGSLTLTVGIQPVKAELGILSETESPTEFTDFHNGTRLLTIDYGNGTIDVITETFTRKTAKLLLLENETIQSLSATLPTSLEESTEYINTTQTLMTEQEVLLGFTYDIAYLRKEWNVTGGWWIFEWEVKAGVIIDVRCGLRLPINVTLEYPEQMTWGDNYSIYATLNPIDKPDFDEFLFTFKANVWTEARIVGLNVPIKYMYGPSIDKSQSFQTPIGPEAEAPLLSLDIDLFELITKIDPSLEQLVKLLSLVFRPYLILELAFNSKKITAMAKVLGDASVVERADLTWSSPCQRENFTVNANDYNNNNMAEIAKIKLSDFKYYFTELALNFKLFLDFNSLINALGIKDPEVTIFTVDLSWLVEGLYLGTHSGYSGCVYATIIVNRRLGPPERVEPRDIALVRATVNPNIVYAGRIVNITVTAKNLGNVTESFNVTIYYSILTIGIWSDVQLEPSENITLTFLWDTVGLPECRTYTVLAEVSTVPNEIDTDDNILVVGTVKIRMFGDVNTDGKVNMVDVGLVAHAFGSYPGHLRWYSEADGNGDNRIDLRDIGIVCANFGKTA